MFDIGRVSDNGIVFIRWKHILKEINAIDMVINTFGLYSPKTLEKISHSQKPWIEKRYGYKEDEAGREVIDENSIRLFYEENNLNSEENIMRYIMNCIKKTQCV